MAELSLQVDTSASNAETSSGALAATPDGSGRNLPPSPRACIFFAQGFCKNGDACRFSHDQRLKEQAMSSLTPSPPPLLVNIPPGHPVFSVDVECVATGVQHNARSIAQVALVDEWGRLLFNVFIKQDVPVISYLTELTGITKDILDNYGMPLADALALLRSYLSPSAILVGQSIGKDVQWLQLAKGVDYHSIIDLSELFRVWNATRGTYTNFSQDHCAKIWLGIAERSRHDAVTDAAISMNLFNAYRTVQWNPAQLHQLQIATLTAPRILGFSSTHPVLDGCCMGNRKRCTCGAPFE